MLHAVLKYYDYFSGADDPDRPALLAKQSRATIDRRARCECVVCSRLIVLFVVRMRNVGIAVCGGIIICVSDRISSMLSGTQLTVRLMFTANL